MKYEKFFRSHILVDNFDKILELYRNQLKNLEGNFGLKHGRIGYILTLDKVQPCIYFTNAAKVEEIEAAQSSCYGEIHIADRLHFISDDIFVDIYHFFEDVEDALRLSKSGITISTAVEYDGEFYPILFHSALCMTIPDIDIDFNIGK